MVSSILLNILAPILLLVMLGSLLRWKFKIDIATLSKINIYLLNPAFIFDKVSQSTLSWAEMGGVVIVSVLQVLTLGLLIFGIGKAVRIKGETLAAIALAVMFYNSGNYGLPLAELAFPSENSLIGARAVDATPPAAVDSTQGTTEHAPRVSKDGGAVQAFVVMTQGLLTFTVGMFIATYAGGTSASAGLIKILRLPNIWTLLAGILAAWWLRQDATRNLPILISATAGYLSQAMVPMALMTLGAQLASNPRWPRWKPVSAVLVLRLIIGPLQMALLLWGLSKTGISALDLWGEHAWPAQILILTAAVPTAVNTLLLVLELGGDADLAADCVFWTTIFSSVTIVGWLVIIRMWFV